ncbi:MAG: hypothetical protein H6600_03675 [Flavobacteriales bacterium]|nr:hypothetical protein [Flavobacteriales bacterium]
MPQPLYITKKNYPVALPFDRVKEFVVITAIETDQQFRDLIHQGFHLKAVTQNANGGNSQQPITVDRLQDKLRTLPVQVYIPLNMADVISATIEVGFYGEDQELESPIKLHYEIIEKLPMQIPDAGFSAHLGDLRNHKILFSGKFGQGKSTFLDYYFKEREDLYNVFRLFPVNYSVASNEDIFRYIKCELIFQLLANNSDFDKENVGHSISREEFLDMNLDRVLAPLLLLAPKVGRNMYQMFEKYKELYAEYQKYHDSIQTDDKALAESYLQHFNEEEGGLFEDDFYTQLIRQQLQKLKVEDHRKENILVIDDLDRMDPDHIFRILNVFSAHFDQFHIYGNDTGNKFGFDRIILVCDYENLRHIYEYRYGKKVDFTGYINKYYSTEKFDFNNKSVVKRIFEDIDRYGSTSGVLERPDYQFLYYMGTALFNAGLISLRDILNMQTIGLKTIFPEAEALKGIRTYWLGVSEFVCPILLLAKAGSYETLKRNVLDLKEKHFEQSLNWTDKSVLIQGCLYDNNTKDIKIPYKGNEYHYLNASFNDRNKSFLGNTGYTVFITNAQINNTFSPEYSFEEFKIFLIDLIDRIKELKENK